MASSYHHYLNCSNPHGYSKSQMCLFKILHIISSIPPSKQQPFLPTNNKGIGIDLNLRFCSIEEDSTGESESSAVTASNASAVDIQANNNEEEKEAEVEVEEGIGEKSDEDTQLQSFEVDNNNNNGVLDHGIGAGGGDDSNCLDLLIEAARVLSGKDESDSEERSELRTQEEGGRVKKRKERWVVVDLYGDVVEEREPVVRSKRGRSQALPYRFRDSVVEPLKRSGRSQRPSSTTNARKRLLH